MANEPTVLDKLFEPEDSNNPGGRCSSAADLANIRKFNRYEATRVIHKYINMPLAEMLSLVDKGNQEYLKNLPAIEVMTLKIVSDAVIAGDYKKMDFLLNRLMGRTRTESELPTKEPGEEAQGGVLILPANGRD